MLIKLTTIDGHAIWLNMTSVAYIAELISEKGEALGCIVALSKPEEKITVKESMRDVFDRLSGRGGIDVPRIVQK